MRKQRIAVAGGSMGGLFASALLSAAGHEVVTFERSVSGLEGRGAGLVAQQEVYQILAAAGLDDVARIGVTAYERVYLDRAGRIAKRFDMPQTQISWDVLFRSFRSLIPDDRYRGGAEVVAAQEDTRGAALKFADGTIVEADLVIGADGIGSRVRPAVAGRDSVPRYVGYAAWRSLLPEAKLAAVAQTALSERFAFYDAPNVHALGYLVPGADGSLAPGSRRYNCVWYRPHSESDGELASILTDRRGVTHPYSLSPGMMSDHWRSEFIEAAADLLPPPFSSVIAAEEDPFIQAICDYVTPAMASERIALLGDAAFVVRPHTAMGVSKAAGDALSLNVCLDISRDIPEALKRYNAERWPVGREIAAYGQRLGRTLALDQEAEV